MIETDLLQWIKNKGYAYTWNFRLSGRTPDVIAFDSSRVIAFEIKRSSAEISTAIGQCIQYLRETNAAYVVLPAGEIRKLGNSTLAALEKHGIGLIEINNRVKVHLEAKFFTRNTKLLIEELNRKSLVGISPPQRADISTNRERLIAVLRQHPYGLPILELAKLAGLHRHTATKYVYELVGAGVVTLREVGSAKLCILNESFAEKGSEKKILKKLKERQVL